MMRGTHEPFGAAWWTGTTLALNLVYARFGEGLPAGMLPIILPVVLLGIPLAVATSAGRNSPDMDHMWWPGPPRRGPTGESYFIWGHRGITHRPWLAVVLTLATTALVLLGHELTPGLAWWAWPLAYAPVTGWWSHLVGDTIYGRIKWFGRARGLGWRTGGVLETGRGDTLWAKPVPRQPMARGSAVATLLFLAGHAVLGFLTLTA